MLRQVQHIGAAIVILAATGPAFAHPGHGSTPPDRSVHLLEPVHFAPLLLVGLGVGAFASWRSRGTSQP